MTWSRFMEMFGRKGAVAAYSHRLDGFDRDARPPLIVSPINLWKTPERRKVRARLPHGAMVEIVDIEGDLIHVRSGSKHGWVSAAFVRKLGE